MDRDLISAGARSTSDDTERLRRRVAELEALLASLGDAVLGEREHGEEARDAFEEGWRLLLEQSRDGIFIIEPDRDCICDANEPALRMLGYERAELLALPVSAIHPDEMPRLRAFQHEALQRGRAWTDALSCRAKSGARLQVEISAATFEVQGRPRMIAVVHDVTERRRIEAEQQYLRDELRGELGFGIIVGASAALVAVKRQIAAVAGTGASVLITGESGVGKELVATAIHDNSRRRDGPMVRVSCASIPDTLFESEFFGHVKGAFTGALRDRPGRFELAEGGSIFLDEVGEIPFELQAKLLRVLQERQFERVGEDRTRSLDVRVIAATNRTLGDEARAGRFREDLFYRLNVFPIHIPPLRERREDVVPLARHVLSQICTRMGIAAPELGAAHAGALERYDWPGNVRELQNVLERAVILGRDRGVLSLELAPAVRVPSSPELRLGDIPRLEREIVLRALEATGWRVYGAAGAAAQLGVPATTLASRMKRLGINKRAP